MLLGKLNGCQGVGSLATLAYGYHYIIGFDDGFAITELACILYIYSLTAHLLYELLADEGCMPTGSACHDDDMLG